MKYEHYDIIDFIQDEYFIRWVKHPDEQSEKFWKMWMAGHPEKRDELMHARNIIIDLGYKYDPEFTEDDYVEIFEGVLQKSRQEPLKGRLDTSTFLSRALKVAAVIAVVVISVFTVRQFRLPGGGEVSGPVFVAKKNPVGQKIITWLEDGTKVHLNAGSSIHYPEKFRDSSRRVYLEGEAYFEVTKDPGRPFIVETGKVKTTVLGTAFNVRAYPDESKIEVAVVEGKVRVEGENGLSTRFEHTLRHNQMTSYDASGQRSVVRNFDPEEVLAWTRGIIHFKGANINEIIRTLERWYGVRFVVNRALDPDKDFSISYKNKSLEEILEGLSFAFDFEYKMDDKIVTLN
ncbi:MAG: FecR domain-containing protein [Cytophagales bacterium]|nr:FecR domain-containing protein [Cytophagales bacterium]